jgi:hypothetical protein
MTRKTIVLIAAFVALGTATVGLVTAIFTQRGQTAQRQQLAGAKERLPMIRKEARRARGFSTQDNAANAGHRGSNGI